MAWLGVFFDPQANEHGSRDPKEYFRGLVEPIVYPYAHGFVEAETERLSRSDDPGGIRRGSARYDVFYALEHDGGLSGLHQQGCSILAWLFRNFDAEGRNRIAARFSEIPVVIHAVNDQRAVAMANALTLLRFLGAREDQAVAKMMLCPWDPLATSPRRAAEEYEERVIDFLHGDLFYPETVTLFDVLGRRDLKAQRTLAACCASQIGFIGPLLEWVDECWPSSPEEGRELEQQLRRSLADEARFLARERRRELAEKARAQARAFGG